MCKLHFGTFSSQFASYISFISLNRRQSLHNYSSASVALFFKTHIIYFFNSFESFSIKFHAALSRSYEISVRNYLRFLGNKGLNGFVSNALGDMTLLCSDAVARPGYD